MKKDFPSNYDFNIWKSENVLNLYSNPYSLPYQKLDFYQDIWLNNIILYNNILRLHLQFDGYIFRNSNGCFVIQFTENDLKIIFVWFILLLILFLRRRNFFLTLWDNILLIFLIQYDGILLHFNIIRRIIKNNKTHINNSDAIN